MSFSRSLIIEIHAAEGGADAARGDDPDAQPGRGGKVGDARKVLGRPRPERRVPGAGRAGSGCVRQLKIATTKR